MAVYPVGVGIGIVFGIEALVFAVFDPDSDTDTDSDGDADPDNPAKSRIAARSGRWMT